MEISLSELKASIKNHWISMELLKNGTWEIPALKEYEASLLCQNISETDVNTLVTRVKEGLLQNSYLRSFENKKEQEISDVLNGTPNNLKIEVVSYLFFLEKLTSLCTSNPMLLREIFEFYSQKRDKTKKIKFFQSIKFYSISISVKKGLVDQNTSPFLKSFWIRALLSINIFEAAIFDIFRGFFLNGVKGIILSITFPKEVYRTEDGLINLKFSNTKKWVDAYQSWNIAFMLGTNDYPISVLKLFIPSVCNYQNEPEKYMHKRLIALYFYVIHASYRYSNNYNPKGQKPKTVNKLVKFLGKINLLKS